MERWLGLPLNSAYGNEHPRSFFLFWHRWSWSWTSVNSEQAQSTQLGLLLAWSLGKQAQTEAFRGTLINWRPYWATSFASGGRAGNKFLPQTAVSFSTKSHDVTGVKLDVLLKILFPFDKLSLLGSSHTSVTESKLTYAKMWALGQRITRPLWIRHPVLATAQLYANSCFAKWCCLCFS